MGGRRLAALRGRAQAARREEGYDQPEAFLNRLQHAIEQATGAMLRMQHREGYWWAELESNVTITSEYLMLHRFLGLPENDFPRMVNYILDKQLDNGAWSIW